MRVYDSPSLEAQDQGKSANPKRLRIPQFAEKGSKDPRSRLAKAIPVVLLGHEGTRIWYLSSKFWDSYAWEGSWQEGNADHRYISR